MAAKTKPITIEGITYPSRKAAAEALGIHRRTLSTWLFKRNLMPKRAYNPRTPVTINGIHYSSMKAAAIALDVSGTVISNLYARHGPEFNYTPKPNRKAQAGRPVTIDGTEYKSVIEASRALGINYHKLQRITK